VSPESLTSLVTGGIGAIAVLGIFLTLIVTGRLIIKDSHDEVCEGYKAIIEDKDKQITDLTAALNRQQERADAGVLAARVTTDLVQSIRKATS
jgi:hypothetical protein